MKKIVKFLGILVVGFLLCSLLIGCKEKEAERPDVELCYGIVEERDGVYGAWSSDGDFVSVNPEEFKVGDKVLTIIFYNPNNNVCDDVVKVIREKVE